VLNPSDFFEYIQAHFEKDLPFAVFRKPNSNRVVAFLQNDLNDQPIDAISDGFLIAPFDNSSALLAIRNDKVLSTDFFLPKKTLTNAKDIQWDNVEIKRDHHISLVEKAIQTIQTSELRKVVLATSMTTSSNRTGPITLFKRILECYHNTFNFMFSHPRSGMWLGATPELLLSMEGKQLKTMALAGTRKVGGSTWGSKEVDEQAIVLSEIKHTLSKLPSGFESLSIGKPQTHVAGAIEHILTQVSAKVEASSLEVARALHPTPAVGGVPKSQAVQFISKHESLDRSYYSGFFGPFQKNKTEWYVNLRSMRMGTHQTEIFVGGGVTAASDPHSEWEELLQKADTMGRILFQ
jgi:isochorismate synthase